MLFVEAIEPEAETVVMSVPFSTVAVWYEVVVFFGPKSLYPPNPNHKIITRIITDRIGFWIIF